MIAGACRTCTLKMKTIFFFAQGYIHAQERMWQMDFNRRMVAGRVAEILGEQAVPLDRWTRILGMRRVAEEEVHLLNSPSRAVLQAYADGVNARLSEKRLPVEFTLLQYQPEPWSIADSLSWTKMMAWTLSVNWEAELLRAQLIARLGAEAAAELEPDYGDDYPLIIPKGVDYSCLGGEALDRAAQARRLSGPGSMQGLGSNNWVVSGSRTTSGKPLLANDMHLGMTIPSIWYENHLFGGSLNLSGISFPGIPGIIAGHNGHVAWGFTNGFPDVQDLFIEHLQRQEDGSVLYEFEGQWLPARVRVENIRIKGGSSTTEEVIETHHGPIINKLAPDFCGESPLALRWNALDKNSMLNALIDMNQARNCLEFREALRCWATPTQNTVYADIDGNIAYSFPGNIPIRKNGDGRVPVPGWTGEYEWIGYIPFEELPHLYNPPQGYVVTANNRVTDPGYPHWLGTDHITGNRAGRIRELIESQVKISPDFIQHMHQDQVSIAARKIKEILARVETTDPEIQILLRRMAQWDGHLGADSPEASIYEVFIRQMLKRLLETKLGSDLAARYIGKGPTPVLSEMSILGERAREWLQNTLANPNSPWFENEAGFSRDELVCQVLTESIAMLKQLCGPNLNDWAWGKLHTLTFNHVLGAVKPLDRLFNRGPYPIGGDPDTVWNTAASYHDLSSKSITSAPFRFIADLGNLNNSLGCLVPGQSGQPASPHYADNIADWFSVRYHPMLYRREEVEKHAKDRLTFLPPGESRL